VTLTAGKRSSDGKISASLGYNPPQTAVMRREEPWRLRVAPDPSQSSITRLARGVTGKPQKVSRQVHND